MDSGQEQNYWPGFVDALSNVVLTLVFVLVIFVFALAMASNKVEEKMRQVTKTEEAKAQEEKVQSVQNELSQKQIQELQEQLKQAQEKLAALYAKSGQSAEESDMGKMANRDTSNLDQNKEVTVEKKEDAPQENQNSVDVKNDNQGMLTVKFPGSVNEIDDKAQESLDVIAKQVQADTGATKIVIKSIMGDETFSAAQRTAYYRAMNVRNFLMNKLNVDPANITSTIVKPDNPEAGRVEIFFKK